MASDLDNEFAMYNLGWMYQVGENVNKDTVKAFELYSKSAEKGHPQATFNLANMYFSGEGTTKDIQTAYKLFLQSKIRGIKESEYYINLISSDLSFSQLNVKDGKYVLGFRAEDTKIQKNGNIEGPIYSIELLGDSTIVTLKLKDNLIHVKTDNNFSSKIGENVSIKIPIPKCHFFEFNNGERLNFDI